MFNGEIIFHLKGILKRLCYYKRTRTTRYKFMWDSGLQKFCGHFYHATNILLRDTKYQARNLMCTNTRIEKKRIERLYFPER